MGAPSVSDYMKIAQSRLNQNYAIPKFAGWQPTITYLENGWGVAVATITPALAAAMLATNRDDNRNKRPSAYGRYAADMRSGQWKLTHQGIAFDRNGHLCDGQHRLTGCVSSEVPFPTLVFFGVGANEEMATLDTGAIRSAGDASVYMLGERASHRLLASLRSFLQGVSSSRVCMSNVALLGNLEKYTSFSAFHAVIFHGVTPPGPTRGAIMRAYYHADRDDIIRFAELLVEKIDPTEPRDRSVKLLRKYIESCNSFGGQSSQIELYKKSQRSIAAYLQGDVLDRLYSTNDDLFPLPTSELIQDRAAIEEAITEANKVSK